MGKNRIASAKISRGLFSMLVGAVALGLPPSAHSATQEPLDFAGFIEGTYQARKNVGLTRAQHTAQLELGKQFRDAGIFSELSFNATLRFTYQGVYDLNPSNFGSSAGGPVFLASPATSNPFTGDFLPFGGGVIPPLPPPLGAGFGFDVAANPNQGLAILGGDLHAQGTSLSLAFPVRPCNVDPRGCLKGYLDFTKNDLRFPEFNNRVDALREAYIDATIPVGVAKQLFFRVGRQQVVWGRTDLFRVLDVINPVDFSRNNIFDPLEDIRYPQWILLSELQLGSNKVFDDLNFSVVWNFDRFRPDNLGQGGTPYTILDAGPLMRALKNCWDNGCTVGNFAPLGPPGSPLGAFDFAPGVIGIRNVNLPKWSVNNSQIGFKVEGVFHNVGFSLNYLNYLSRLPSLRAGIPSLNPFTGQVGVFPNIFALDIEFPRINLFGGSLDFYVDSIKSVFRIEATYTSGEEFANTLRPRLFSESDVFRYVIGWDRNTFIPFLNPNRAFLFSFQVFGQHLLNHQLERRPLGLAGIPDWKNNWIVTGLIQGFYKSDRVLPRILVAWDLRAETVAIGPAVEWIVTDNLRLVLGANIKFGRGARQFDDCRTCNPFPPFTGSPATIGQSLGLGGFEPISRFRSGPLGMAVNEDEVTFSIRYSF